MRGVCGGRRLVGGSEAGGGSETGSEAGSETGRLVQTELKPVLQPYGADRFFSLCFEDGVLPSRAVVLFCSSRTQAAARCDGEGLGASAGADGLGVCQWVRCSGQTRAVGFWGWKAGPEAREGAAWRQVGRSNTSGGSGPQALLQSKAEVDASYSDGYEHDTDRPSRAGRNWIGRCPAWAVWLGARRCTRGSYI